MIKSVAILCLLFLFSCGDIDQNENYKNINSKFSITKLRDLSQSEINSSTTLCSDLSDKVAILKSRYMTKFFNYESSIKNCNSEQDTTKNIILTLDTSANTLKFSASSDSNYAFLRPELKDEYGIFSKFCNTVSSGDRYVQISANEVSHFTIKELSDYFEVEVLSSFYDETINGDKQYKVFKNETIKYSKNESANIPKATAISRELETSLGCDDNKLYLKKSSLKSIRD